MLKKILFVLLVIVNLSILGVLLKDGASVPQQEVDRIYNTLKTFKAQSRIGLLSELARVCSKNSHKFDVEAYKIVLEWEYKEKIEAIRKFPKAGLTVLLYESELNREKQKLIIGELNSLNICDKNGNIYPNVANIIENSVNIGWPGRKGILPIGTVSVKYPISWKNYFSPKYLFGKNL